MPKIEEMYAFVMDDEEPDDEGIIGMNAGPLLLPLVGADMDRVNSLKDAAQTISNVAGKPVKILKFEKRSQIGVIEPQLGTGRIAS